MCEQFSNSIVLLAAPPVTGYTVVVELCKPQPERCGLLTRMSILPLGIKAYLKPGLILRPTQRRPNVPLYGRGVTTAIP